MSQSLCYTVHHTVQQLCLFFVEMIIKTYSACAQCNMTYRQMIVVIKNYCNPLSKQELRFMFVIWMLLC